MTDNLTKVGDPEWDSEFVAGRARWVAYIDSLGRDRVVADAREFVHRAETNWLGMRTSTKPRREPSHKPLGQRVLEFANPTTSQIWMRRRVEEIQLLDERTIERRVTFEIDLNDIALSDLPVDERGIYVLPLARLDRSVHATPAVVAQGNRELLRPTAAAERRLVAEGLTATWETQGLSIGTLEKARLAISVNPRGIETNSRLAKYFRETDQGLQLLRSVAAEMNADAISDDNRRRFIGDVARWQRLYLLLVEIPEAFIDKNQLILELTYKESVPERATTYSLFGFDRGRFFSLLRRAIGGSMSWPLRIPVRGIGDAESSHVCLSAPSGFRALDASLRVQSEGSLKNTWIRDDDPLPSDAHAYFGAREKQVRDAEFIVSFYAYKTGFFFESVITSVLMWLVLFSVYHKVSSAQFLPHRYGETMNVAIAATILLLLPVIAVILIIQRDRHRLASKCFSIPRLMLGTSCIALVAASTALSLRLAADTGRVIWNVCLIVATLAAIRMLLGACVHIWRISRLRTYVIANLRAYRDNEGHFAQRREPGRLQRAQLNSWRSFPQVESLEMTWDNDDMDATTESSLNNPVAV